MTPSTPRRSRQRATFVALAVIAIAFGMTSLAKRNRSAIARAIETLRSQVARQALEIDRLKRR
jgi:hypothetical protein